MTRLTRRSTNAINHAIDEATRQREQRAQTEQRGNGLTWRRGNGATRQRTEVAMRRRGNEMARIC